MAIAFNETTVSAQPINPGVTRQRLLAPELVDNSDVLLDRVTLAPGASTRFEPAAKSLVWLPLLAGEAKLETLYYRDRLADTPLFCCRDFLPQYQLTMARRCSMLKSPTPPVSIRASPPRRRFSL
jgi:hypothetical protein